MKKGQANPKLIGIALIVFGLYAVYELKNRDAWVLVLLGLGMAVFG